MHTYIYITLSVNVGNEFVTLEIARVLSSVEWRPTFPPCLRVWFLFVTEKRQTALKGM